MTHHPTGWMSIPDDYGDAHPDSMISVDLENSPLLVKTDSADGSRDDLTVWLFAAEREEVGEVNIVFSHTPQYFLTGCSREWKEFPEEVPSERIKVWRITFTRTSEIRIVIHCNNVKVLDMLLSDSTCANTYTSWDTDSVKEVKKIWFSSIDTASDFYSFYIVFDPGDKLMRVFICMSENFSKFIHFIYNLTSKSEAELEV